MYFYHIFFSNNACVVLNLLTKKLKIVDCANFPLHIFLDTVKINYYCFLIIGDYFCSDTGTIAESCSLVGFRTDLFICNLTCLCMSKGLLVEGVKGTGSVTVLGGGCCLSHRFLLV